jgi:hypothetical protein
MLPNRPVALVAPDTPSPETPVRGHARLSEAPAVARQPGALHRIIAGAVQRGGASAGVSRPRFWLMRFRLLSLLRRLCFKCFRTFPEIFGQIH